VQSHRDFGLESRTPAKKVPVRELEAQGDSTLALPTLGNSSALQYCVFATTFTQTAAHGEVSLPATNNNYVVHARSRALLVEATASKFHRNAGQAGRVERVQIGLSSDEVRDRFGSIPGIQRGGSNDRDGSVVNRCASMLSASAR
jgi:hypothetical protein